MQNFNIIKESEIDETFRVQRIRNDFDIDIKKTKETFSFNIDLEKEDWKIGLIVGNSGTGKTTILKELFKEYSENNYIYKCKSVVDDMPKDKNFEQISKMFYSVGFGSVTSWLKPFNVLSNGEKMRIELARLLLENKEIVAFDEFTSVVDKDVAKTTCIAINKSIKNSDKKFIAVTCHNDVKDYLEADWILDTNNMNFFFIKNKEKKESLLLKNVKEQNRKSLGNIII